MLYPFLFHTQFKDKIWGGNKMKSILNKDFAPLPNCGETWEISGVQGNISVVKNGPLKNASLTTLIEEFKGELLGEKVYKKFGNDFPLLIKFIDANDDLSIQVHPDDALAKKRHNSFGKTEMWYILQADKGSRLNAGFNQPVDEKTYLKHLESNSLDKILNFETVQAGDIFFLPAGRVHYIGKGVFLAEIQQTSDITYRIYDFDRVDDKGNKRELHTEQALAAIDYKHYSAYKTKYTPTPNKAVNVVSCPYFTTNLLELKNTTVERDYAALDSFTILICAEGSTSLSYGPNTALELIAGDSVLIPASLKSISLTTASSSKLLEVYVP